MEDLASVVDEAAVRARRRRPDSTGRASRESRVAALRALFRCATDSGLIAVNPAAALTKPRRVRSRRRALDDHELAELIGPFAPPATTPTSTCSSCGSTSSRAPVAKAP